MKKTYFTVIAVALAVLLAGCDGFLAPPESEQDKEEGLIISFLTSDGSVTNDASRALTTPIAAAGADYFEVIFDNGSREVRTSWGNGAIGRIIPGDGNYDNSTTGDVGTPPTVDVRGKAYMFAGRNGTLLGVGVLVDVIEGNTPTGTTVIDMSKATRVVFEITALNTDVGGLKNPTGPIVPPATKPDTDPANSTFKIELAPSSPFSGNMVGSVLLDASQTPNLTAPVFVVVPGTSALEAIFDITDTDGVSLGNALYDDIRSAIITVSTSPLLNLADCSGYLWEAGNSPFAKVAASITSITTVGNEIVIPVTLDVTPGTKAGLSQLSIEIPVNLYNTATAMNGADPYPWYIRGGLNNTSADQGAAFNDDDGSLGGAILIGVGDYNKNAAGLIIGFKPIQ